METVSITGNTTLIDEGTFVYCSSLKSVTLPDSLQSLDITAFDTASDSLKNDENLKDGAYYIQTASNPYFLLYAVQDKSCENFVINEQTKFIFSSTFSECASLTSIVIPNNVKSLGSKVFSSCSNLASVTIPDGLESMEDDVFDGCTALENDNYLKGDIYYIGSQANPYLMLLSVKDKTKTSYTINSNTKYIRRSAFYSCEQLTSVTLPSSIKSIGQEAFRSCKSLLTIVIPDGVEEIKQGTFEDCTALTSVQIPDSVKEIGWLSFSGCSSLTFIVLPQKLEAIAEDVFNGCDAMKTITINALTPPSRNIHDEGSLWFAGAKNLEKIYVPAESLQEYKNADGWSDYASIIEAIQ